MSRGREWFVVWIVRGISHSRGGIHKRSLAGEEKKLDRSSK
jgi:hypothetical protein